MPLPTTKQELLERLRGVHEKLDLEFDDVSEEDSRVAGIEGGVSCCDVLAYQVGWGRLLLGWERAERAGRAPAMPAKGYQWNELGRLAESFHANLGPRGMKALRRELRRTVERIAAMIDSLSEPELFEIGARAWAGEKWPVVKWIQVNTIAPHASARTKVRRWKKTRR